MNCSSLRHRCYAHLFLLDDRASSLEDTIALRQQAAQEVDVLLSHEAQSADEQAEILWTALVARQVIIGDDDTVNDILRLAYNLLPDIQSPRIRCHLMAWMFAENQDEQLLEEVRRLLPQLEHDDELPFLQQFLSVQQDMPVQQDMSSCCQS